MQVDAQAPLLNSRKALVRLVQNKQPQQEAAVCQRKDAREQCQRMLQVVEDAIYWEGIRAVPSHLLPIKVLCRTLLGCVAVLLGCP